MSLRFDSAISKIALMTSDELKAFRERLGLKQDQLAELLKVAPNTVSRWELGTRKMPEFLELALESIENKKPSNQFSKITFSLPNLYVQHGKSPQEFLDPFFSGYDYLVKSGKDNSTIFELQFERVITNDEAIKSILNLKDSLELKEIEFNLTDSKENKLFVFQKG